MLEHLYWTRELTTLEQKLLGSRSCDSCHSASTLTTVLTIDTGLVFYLCALCRDHTAAKES